ncbi:MAG: RNA-directed DNA polymerase, partial [Planctomycetota bacterium]
MLWPPGRRVNPMGLLDWIKGLLRPSDYGASHADRNTPGAHLAGYGRGPVGLNRFDALNAPLQDNVNEEPLAMHGLPVLRDWNELANAMGLSRAELNWLGAPLRRMASHAPHDHVLPRKKKSGGTRYLLAPRTRLKSAQRWVLREILDRVPASEHAQGFVAGRSTRSHAAPHTQRRVVLQMDLRDFFHQFSMRDLRRLFCTLGYGSQVSNAPAFLTTVPLRYSIWKMAKSLAVDPYQLAKAIKPSVGYRGLHAFPSQGSPTSLTISNLLCHRLDARLAALAAKFDATYTRYVDDLCFSGDEAFRRDMR